MSNISMTTTAEQNLENKVTTSDAMKDSAQSVPPLKQEPVDSPVSNQNGTSDGGSGRLDPSKPIKTEGEASAVENSFLPRTLPLQSSQPSLITSSPVTPFVPNLGSLSAQLSTEEHTGIYKKANILALSALAKKGGPNTKDMFTVQQKLQEFLTSLITLAGQKGPQLKVTVQMLVQNLVTGQISEEEFATKIESDLHSQHQPSLLPFLKSSVPHLKTRLQLQQAIMKELIQRAIAEKKGLSSSSSSSSSTSSSTQTTNTTTSLATSTVTPTMLATDSSLSANQVSSSSSSLSTVMPQVVVSATFPPTTSLVKVTRGATGVGGQNIAKPLVIGTAAISIGNQGTPTNQRVGGVPENFGLQFPKGVHEHIAKLPAEQQLLCIQKILKNPQLMQQHQKNVREKQQKLVQEQQVPLVMGVGRSASAINISRGSVVATARPGASNSVGVVSRGASGGVAIGTAARITTTGIMDLKGKGSASLKVGPGGALASSPGSSKKKGKGKESQLDADDDEEVGMDILDEVVNLQEETAQFLPKSVGDSTVTRSCKDIVFLNTARLKQKVEGILRVNGMQDCSEDLLACVSHATQERLRDVIEKMTEIGRHRVEVLKDDNHYRVQSEVRSQFRVLETIDRIICKRKLERDNEQTLRAAKSRSKGADPEKAAKIREEAKQIQQDEATRLRNESANRTALAASRKRPLPSSASDAPGSGGSSLPKTAEGVASSASLMASSLFAPLASTRAPKRHVTSRDLIFYMEQERETRKTLSLYKTLL